MTQTAIGQPALRPKNPQLFAFLILVAVVGVFGVLFFQVVRSMLLPLFLAAVVAMLAYPLQQRLTILCRGYAHVAAGCVVTIIILAILAPLATGTYLAGKQLIAALRHMQDSIAAEDAIPFWETDPDSLFAGLVERIKPYADIDAGQIKNAGLRLARSVGQGVYEGTVELLGDLAGFCFSVVIFLIALYFFLVDGERIMAGWEDLTPMDAEHDRILRTEFSKVCRGVVWATIAAAVVQGLLFGIGLWIIDLVADVGMARWIFLLTLLTVVFAMIPFFGSTAVWLPVALYLVYAGHLVAGIALGLYGLLFVSTADNVIKVLVLKGQVSMHPLLVLVCVFGGIRLVGILGAFIGPIVGAVLFALLRVMKRELLAMHQPTETPVGRVSSLRRPKPSGPIGKRLPVGAGRN